MSEQDLDSDLLPVNADCGGARWRKALAAAAASRTGRGRHELAIWELTRDGGAASVAGKVHLSDHGPHSAHPHYCTTYGSN